MQKALNSENIQKIKNDLMSYVYSVSKVPSRTLFFKYTEAKELLCKNPLETRKIINLKLFPTDSNDDLTKKVSENTESFEYSITETDKNNEYLSSIENEMIVIDEQIEINNKDSTILNEFIESPRFTSLESIESSIHELETPVVSPQKIEVPISKIQLILKLQELQSQIETNKNKDFESEKVSLKTNCSESYNSKFDEGQNLYKCEFCSLM